MLTDPSGEFLSQVLEVQPLYEAWGPVCFEGREGGKQESFILALEY